MAEVIEYGPLPFSPVRPTSTIFVRGRDLGPPGSARLEFDADATGELTLHLDVVAWGPGVNPTLDDAVFRIPMVIGRVLQTGRFILTFADGTEFLPYFDDHSETLGIPFTFSPLMDEYRMSLVRTTDGGVVGASTDDIWNIGAILERDGVLWKPPEVQHAGGGAASAIDPAASSLSINLVGLWCNAGATLQQGVYVGVPAFQSGKTTLTYSMLFPRGRTPKGFQGPVGEVAIWKRIDVVEMQETRQWP